MILHPQEHSLRIRCPTAPIRRLMVNRMDPAGTVRPAALGGPLLQYQLQELRQQPAGLRAVAETVQGRLPLLG